MFLLAIYCSNRLKAASETDTRVKIMNEVISGIRVIKMYGWEYAFERLVANIRKYVNLGPPLSPLHLLSQSAPLTPSSPTLCFSQSFLSLSLTQAHTTSYFNKSFLPHRKEVNTILKSSVIRAINLSYYVIALPTIMFVIFSVYASSEGINSLSPKKVFTTFSLLTFVRLTSINFLVKGSIQVAEARVALQRIKV